MPASPPRAAKTRRPSKRNTPVAPGAAFFDLDRTLVRGGSGPVFARTLARLGVSTPHIPGQDALFRLYDLFGESFVLMQLARRASSRAAGLDRAEVMAAAELAADELISMVPAFVPGLLDEHRSRNERIYLATTSPFDLVAPFADRLGLDGVVATRYAEVDGRYTGQLDGQLVWGRGKLAAVEAFALRNNIQLNSSWAYSDSVFDLPLLSAVGNPVAVNPDIRLAAVAAFRRWPIRSLDVPSGVPKLFGAEPLDFARRALRPELLPFVRFDFSGVEQLPTNGPAIIAVNHRSYFDPFAIAFALAQAGRNARFLAKKEVTDAPIIGNLAKAFGTIRVERGSGSDKPLRAAAMALEAGEIVVIMPQGTIPRGEAFFAPKLQGRAGVVRLANMTGAPIVPMGLWNTEAVWPRSAKVPSVWNIANPPRVHVAVGPPVAALRGTVAAEQTDLATVLGAIEALLPAESREHRVPSDAALARSRP